MPANLADVEKKTAHAAEQDRPDIRKRRAAWFEGQLDLDPERLGFIDETWASSRTAGVHRRDLGFHQHGPALRTGPARSAPSGRRAARALEDNHARGRA